MTEKELLDAWSNVSHAVAWTELIICQATRDDPESSWQMMDAHGVEIEDRLQMIRETVEEEMQEGNEVLNRLPQVLEQMRHPDYRKYIAGRIGLL